MLPPPAQDYKPDFLPADAMQIAERVEKRRKGAKKRLIGRKSVFRIGPRSVSGGPPICLIAPSTKLGPPHPYLFAAGIFLVFSSGAGPCFAANP
jgi:hypothetical protein